MYTLNNLRKKLVTQKITEEEYELLKDFNEDFQKYANIYDCFFNVMKSLEELNTFNEGAKYDDKITLNILYAEYKYLIYKYILFTRQLVDNMKSFGAQIKNENIETIIKEYEKKDESQFLKVLRDFGQHFSLPITNFSKEIDIVSGEITCELIIEKNHLEKNKGKNDKNDKYISSIELEEINVLNYLPEWEKNILDLFSIIIKEFCLSIDKNTTKILREYFQPHKDGDYFFSPDSISLGEDVGGSFYSKETFYFDENAMLIMVSIINTIDNQ